MKKVLKRLSVVALSALMVGGAVASFSGCGTSDDTISVYIFAGTEDQDTNKAIVENWAAEYSEKLVEDGIKPEGYQISTKCSFQSVTSTYFDSLIKALSAGTAQDVFYVSPKYVKAWAKKGYVLELSQYMSDLSAKGVDLSQVYSQALGFYAYDGENVGDPVTYNSETGKFVNDVSHKDAGIYAFPKDYSTFGLAYNAVYFSDARKAVYNSTKALSTDKASDGKSIIRTTATGAEANIINVGVPTTYFPYNFYKWSSYEEALENDDPVARLSDMNGGYTVTIPGYPGETYTKSSYDSSAVWNDSIGYITYTYAEYGAISWALTYYYNKLAGGSYTSDVIPTPTSSVYANDQHDLNTLYLLPWLAGNDANYINAEETTDSSGNKIKAYQSVTSGTYVDDNGKTITYGIDSDKFIETYGAFTAYGSDWNGNSYYCGDGNTSGGYIEFMNGNCLFYGIGTWDAAGFDGCDESILQYRVMPEPVSESHALYSRVKDAEYKSRVYTNGTSSADTTDSKAEASYSPAEIQANQDERQEAWACRIDSVGYGVNAKVAEGSSADWKLEACVDLAITMTLDPDAQTELTFAGSQLPNYENMCVDYVNLTGDFAKAITPEHKDWALYYKAQSELTANKSRDITVGEYMAQNYPTLTYNEAYKDYTLKQINSGVRAYCALNMIALDYNSRNLNLRMVEGVNGVTEATIYTYQSTWIDTFVKYKEKNLTAWTLKDSYSGSWVNDPDAVGDSTICTPYAYCKHYASAVQATLNDSISAEEKALGD